MRDNTTVCSPVHAIELTKHVVSFVSDTGLNLLLSHVEACSDKLSLFFKSENLNLPLWGQVADAQP